MACFVVSSNTVVIGQVDTFTNCSQNASSFQWYFGDGDTDLVNQSPAHTFSQPGTFAVKLVAIGNKGKTDNTSQNVTIGLPAYTSANYIGTYSGTESCSLSGNANLSITIAVNGYLSLYISNLYGTGKVFSGSVSGTTVNISAQLYNNGSGDAILEGTITQMPDNSLTVSLIVTTFGKRDVCQANFIKQ